jgi:hypothetical protein
MPFMEVSAILQQQAELKEDQEITTRSIIPNSSSITLNQLLGQSSFLAQAEQSLKIPLQHLFDFSNISWIDDHECFAFKSFEKELELHTLLDHEAEGDDIYSIDVISEDILLQQ